MKNTGTKDNVVQQNRIGKFTVFRKLIEQMPDKLLRSFFGRFVVVRAEHMFHTNSFDYIAYSEYFEAKEVNQEIPVYDLYITEKKGQIINVKTVKKEQEA